ncbi:unnamed protein product [Victoria cruziana]
MLATATARTKKRGGSGGYRGERTNKTSLDSAFVRFVSRLHGEAQTHQSSSPCFISAITSMFHESTPVVKFTEPFPLCLIQLGTH